VATPEQVTLARALSIKDRLAGRLAQARVNVEQYNSVLAAQTNIDALAWIDVRAEYARYRKLQDGLIALKAEIQRASQPISEDLLQLRELEDLVEFLGGLNTRHGSEPGHTGIELRYVAEIKKPEVLEMVRKLEVEIDEIQDKINQFNVSTRIEIPGWILDLAR
jgi:hypothetical protein